jgi:hypothetical protein
VHDGNEPVTRRSACVVIPRRRRPFE